MATQNVDLDSRIVDRYTDQPTRMPPELRASIEASWRGEPVQLYAMADLDAGMRLARTWVALGPERIAVVREDNGRPADRLHSFERSRIQEVREVPGLSCTVLTLLASPDEPPLAVFRYTHRQRRAMENVRFLLENGPRTQSLAGNDADRVYSGSMAQPVKEAQASFTRNKIAVLWRLLAYLGPYRRRVIFGMAAAALMTAVSLLPPYLTGYLIDRVVRPFQAGRLTLDGATRFAWLMIGALAVIYLLRGVFLWVRFRTMAVLGEYVSRDLRTDLYEHLQQLSMRYFSRKQTGSIISRVSSDTDRIWDFVAFGVVEVSISLLMLLGLAIVLLSLDWQLGLALTVPVPAMLWAILVHGRRINRLFIRAWRKWSNLTDVLSDTIPGIRVVKAFNQEDREQGRFRTRNYSFTSSCNDIHSSWTTFWPMLMLGIHLLTLLVWVVALPRLFRDGDAAGSGLTVGTFVSFLLYMTMFVQPIEVIGQMARMLNRATSSAHRIFEVLDTEPEIVDTVDPVRLEPLEGRVTFENVTFAYDGLRQVIKRISFDVKPGEMVGLVGPSGGGKTTVTNLIARFYDPSGGRILIDGVDLRNLDTGHYRRQIGMVLQDPYLFHGTILDNIRYGLPEASIDQAVDAARAANAHDFICKLAHGYDTVVGERGHTLSGGERQRISIARAILNNPCILILDEATSSVDTETERRIQQALDRLVSGRTVFAIAHRLSTLTRADRLFVIEDGRIAEQGTHAELLAKPDGAYRKLHQLQQELHEIYAV